MSPRGKKILKKALSESLWNKLKKAKRFFSTLSYRVKIRLVERNHNIALRKIKGKEKIKVAFFLIHHADWKYEGVYKLMCNDIRFEPVVFICPYTSHGEENMMMVMDRAYKTFEKEGYHVVKTYNEQTNVWLDIKNEVKPDVVCFTSPWDLTRSEYLIKNFLDTLTCYVPYGFKISHLYEAHFNRPMQNFVWKFFLETPIHKKLSLKYSTNNSRNTVITGYPGMDRFLGELQEYRDVWKIKDKKIKRIIWAPHHTIPGMGATLDYSTFLDYAEPMLKLADEFKEEIQISFKPHPILRSNLSKEEVWGKKRTDDYYQTWENLSNGQLNEGEYLDLFFTSDGIIHDSGSFIIEYLYTGRPVMFLLTDDSVFNRFNEIGKAALANFYLGRNSEDVREYIRKVIIEGEDNFKEKRKHFFEEVVSPPNHLTASENIFNHIKSQIFS